MQDAQFRTSLQFCGERHIFGVLTKANTSYRGVRWKLPDFCHCRRIVVDEQGRSSMGSSMSAAALEVSVVAYAGESISVPMVCRLDSQAGITIGRNPGNDLVLDDPARQVSRFQARVTAGRSSIELSNVSSQSCVLVNGAEIKPGEAAKIHVGDQIVMGRYLLEIRTADPTAEEAAEPAPLVPAMEPEPGYEPDLTAVHSSQQIPDDYDVFAPPEREAAQPVELQVNSLSDFTDAHSQALLQDLEAAPAMGPQNLFDDEPADAGALLGLVDDKRDPMQLFGKAASDRVPDTLALDHAPEMDRFIRLPVYEKTEVPDEPETDATQLADAQLLTTESVQAPVADMSQPAEQVPEPSLDTPSQPDCDLQPPALNPDSALPLEEGRHPHTGSLKEALATGAGLPVETLPELTPELMHELGTILKSMSDGTVRLMHSRSMTKHEMRANVTIIASAGNNPIKFAPDGTAALQQMLGKRFSGFMQPIAAIEDAFDDLSAHQLGLLAGARRAALELIEQLNPEQTVAEHEPSGVLEGVLPFLKEAKLWRKHQRQYKKVADDQEGLARLIERSFVKSYEEEIERIYTGRGQ